MGDFINNSKQTKFDFGFDNLDLTRSEKGERKMWSKIRKNNKKYYHKIESDKNKIDEIVSSINEDEVIDIIGNCIDAPNIINAFMDRIKFLYISTWSVTPAGIACLENIASNGNLDQAIMIMDKTHSYKWIFASGAYQFLKDKVKIRFCAAHCKFIVMQMSDGTYLNFVGSMNLSNNPRWEQVSVSKSKTDFEFYRDFILNVASEQLK